MGVNIPKDKIKIIYVSIFRKNYPKLILVLNKFSIFLRNLLENYLFIYIFKFPKNQSQMNSRTFGNILYIYINL